MSTTGQSTLDRDDLRATLADVFDLPEEDLTDTALFVDDLGVDSLMSLEVLVVLERKYGIKLDESQLRSLTCLQQTYDVVRDRLGR
ncbi:acyl carrier protein [Streptomyces sp. NPDC048191]|uniref:acyl carrier protein n=1 Tax=Streptomyces sp. NPDC048191 TaxID=3155484 RepID=UPI0033C9B7FA